MAKKQQEKPKLRPIHMFLEEGMLNRIEDFRFANRHKTRVDAIKALLERGLTVVPSRRQPAIQPQNSKEPRPPKHL